MKLLHTADWHLGKRLEHVSRLEEQRQVLDEICEIADREAVDAVLIAGDLYDSPNPSIEAIELFYQTLKRLTDGGRRAVVGIAGNHDAPDRIQAPDPLARASGILLTGYPQAEIRPFALDTGLKMLRAAPGFAELQLPGHEAPLRLILTPYANEVRLRRFLGDEDKTAELRGLLQDHWQDLAETYCDKAGVNILMTHLFVLRKGAETEGLEDESERSILHVGGAPEMYAELFPPQLDYVALGHLHGLIKVQTDPFPVIYSSSPLCYSVNDRDKTKHVVIVEAEPGQPAQFRPIPLSRGKIALQQRCASVEEALQWLESNPDCLVELTVCTDQHLTAQDRKALHDAHAGIVRLIPEFTNPDELKFTSGKQIDLSRNMEDLFAEYFAARRGQPINEELAALFREVLAEEEREDN